MRNFFFTFLLNVLRIHHPGQTIRRSASNDPASPCPRHLQILGPNGTTESGQSALPRLESGEEIYSPKRTRQEGTILIEVTMGIAVVGIALVGMVSLSLASINTQLISKQLQESDLLTQQCLEGIRQIRDGIGFAVNAGEERTWDWDDPELWNDNAPNYFRIYLDQNDYYWRLEKMTAAENEIFSDEYRLGFHLPTGSYGYEGMGGFPTNSSISPFYRQVVIQDYQNRSTTKEVTCRLGWTTRGVERDTEATTLLSQW